MIRLMRGVINVFMVVILASCVEPIDITPSNGQSLVVYCMLTDSDLQTLELCYTSDVADAERKIVEDASVSLSCNHERVVDFSKGENGIWTADFRPEYGKQYRLDVKVGEQNLEAYTLFPHDVQVDTYGRRRWSDNSRRRISYLMYSYELRLYDEEFPEPPYMGREYPFACHLWIFPKDMGWGDDYQKYIATTHFCADDFNLTSLYVRDLPCFSSDSVKVMDKWVKEELAWYPAKLGDLQLHQGFVRIDSPKGYRSGQSQEMLTNTPVYTDKSFALARSFPVSWSDSKGPYKKSVYDIYILSDEADSYFKDVYGKHLNKNNFLFEYDTDNIYSNIKGGYGVFGAMVLRNEKSGVRGYLDDWMTLD